MKNTKLILILPAMLSSLCSFAASTVESYEDQLIKILSAPTITLTDMGYAARLAEIAKVPFELYMPNGRYAVKKINGLALLAKHSNLAHTLEVAQVYAGYKGLSGIMELSDVVNAQEILLTKKKKAMEEVQARKSSEQNVLEPEVERREAAFEEYIKKHKEFLRVKYNKR